MATLGTRYWTYGVGAISRVVAVLLVAAILFSEASAAKAMKPFRVADWAGHAHFDDHAKKFTHCSANSANSRGISVSYIVNDQYEWILQFSNSAWNFSPGYSLVLALKINDQNFPNQRAIFLSERTFQIQSDDSLTVFEMLQLGRKLEIHARGMNLQFDLNASDEVLFALVDCVDRQTGRGQHSKPVSRNAKRSSLAKTSAAPDAGAMAEAKSLATQIIDHAQIPGSQVMASHANGITSGQQTKVFWKAGTVLGSVEVLPPHSIFKIDELAIRIVSQDAVGCRGKLFAATAQSQGGQANVVKAITSCRSPEVTTIKYYLGVPREGGGYYVLETSDTGLDSADPNQRPAKLMNNRVGAVIAQVLSKFKSRNETFAE